MIELLVRIVAGLIGFGIIALGVFIVLFLTHYGDRPPPRGVVVVNRTQIDLNIYVHLRGNPPVLRADVPADSKVATGITCGNLEMTAKNPAGRVIARRGPFPTCDESDWVIAMTAPRVLRHRAITPLLYRTAEATCGGISLSGLSSPAPS